MKELNLLITMGIIISFSISILTSYLITNSNKLQTDSICDMNCNAGYSGGSMNPAMSFHLDPNKMLKDVVGSTVDPKFDIYLTILDKTVT